MIILVEKLSIGQKKFLAEFLGNFSLAWVLGSVVSPFLAGNWLEKYSSVNLAVGLINAVWSFSLAIILTKGIRS